MNAKLAETLAGWRANRDEDSPTIAALDAAERLLAKLEHDPRCVYAFDNGIAIALNSLSEIEIYDDGTTSVVFWNETKDSCLCILPLKDAEVTA